MAEDDRYDLVGPANGSPPYPRGHSRDRFPADEPVGESEAFRPVGEYVHFVLGLIRRNLLVILGVTVVMVGLVAWTFRDERPMYEASAVVRLADARGSLTQGIDAGARGAVPIVSVDPLQTEIHILRSRRVIGEAVDATGYRLQPRHDPKLATIIEEVRVDPTARVDSIRLTFREDTVVALAGSRRIAAAYGETIDVSGVRFLVRHRPDEGTGGVLSLLSREGAIDRMRGRLTVTPRRQTDIVDVQFAAPTPSEARRVVNAVVDVFQAMDAEMAQQQALRRRDFLATQVARNDSLLAEAQLALSSYENRARERSGPDRLAAQRTAVANLEQRLRDLRAQRRAYESVLQTAQESEGSRRLDELRVLLSSPGVGSNPVVSGLYQELSRYQTTRDTLLSTGRTPTNPDVKRVESLIASTEAKLIQAFHSHLGALDTQIESLEEIREGSSTALREDTPPPSAEATALQLQEQVQSIRAMADLVREEYQRAQIAAAVEGGQVEIIDYATGTRRVPTSVRRYLMFSSVIGLLLGIGLAYLRESMDTAIHVGEELEHAAHIPTLATIPQIRLPGRSGGLRKFLGNGGGEETAYDEGSYHSPGMEAFRKLSTALTYYSGDTRIGKIVVTSALPGEGKSTTAANLAVACAQSGRRVLLIDCDIAQPVLHRLFDTERGPGFLQVLNRKIPLKEALRDTRYAGLRLLTAGPVSDEPGVFNRVRMVDLLGQVSADFDLIIMDAPPVLPTANATILATVAEGVILVTRSGKTGRASVRSALDELSLVGAPVVGTVLNDPDGELDRYGYGQVQYYPQAAAR